MYAKTHAGIPLSAEEREAEIRKIKQAVAHFSNQMEARLVEKLDQGWRGWDRPENAREIYNCLLAHGSAIHLAAGQEVDMANFAMFLWYIRTFQKGPPDPSPIAPGGPVSGQGGAAAEAVSAERAA